MSRRKEPLIPADLLDQLLAGGDAAAALQQGGLLDSLKKAGGQGAVDKVKFVPDANIRRIVAGWPMRFDAARAKALGFKADDNFDQIVQGFVEDDLRRNVA